MFDSLSSKTFEQKFGFSLAPSMCVHMILTHMITTVITARKL